MNTSVRLELSVDTLASVLVADRIGADRVELCTASGEGGLTPSHGLISEAVRRCENAEVHVLIRPRPGDFTYSRGEIDVMIADVADAVALGATGVVTGVLDAGRELNVTAMRKLVAAAGSSEVTFHRAMDVCADPLSLHAGLAELGVTRVLTSGQAPTATEGAVLITELVRAATGGPAIMACGGVRRHNVTEVLRTTGVSDLHAAPREPVRAAATSPSPLAFAAGNVPAGFDHAELDESVAEELRRVTWYPTRFAG